MITSPRALIALTPLFFSATVVVLLALSPPRPAPVPSLSAAPALAWHRQEPPLSPTWPDQPRFTSDAARRPVHAAGLVLLTSSRDDSLTAVGREDGAVKWRFTADGPIRFAPAVHGGKAYVASDDGRLYCLSLEDGKQLWAFRGAPGGRLVLGNERLINAWPARGAPAVAVDGDRATVYFAAGIWPFMGIFLYALDANTGEVRWCNSGDGSTYIKQPHNTDAFAGVAPQGALVVSGNYLIVPGGRSVPAVYHKHSGRLLHYRLAETSKRGGGPDVLACGGLYVNGGGTFALQTGRFLGPVSELVCAEGDWLFAARGDTLEAFEVERRPAPPPEQAGGGKKNRAPAPSKDWLGKPSASLHVGKATALAAGRGVVYVGGPGRLAAAVMTGGRPRVAWVADLEGTPAHIAASGGEVTVSTREGGIFHFRHGAGKTARHEHKPERLPQASPEEAALVSSWLKWARTKEGYAVVANAAPGVVAELLRRSAFSLVLLQPDEDKAAELRRQLRAAGIDGKRAAVLPLSAAQAELPPYLCSLLAVADGQGLNGGAALLERLAGALRPYGGVACLPPGLMSGEAIQAWRGNSKLVGAPKIERREGWLLLRRDGPLPGAADWTHQHADPANTRVSKDQLVRAPLGLLWFGGVGNQDILPRHGHGPVPQSVGGRVIVEGMNALRAIDAYTGRLLWQTSLPGVGRVYDNTAHQAGANATGGNYASTPHGVYVLLGGECLRLDVDTGRVKQRYTQPPMPDQKGPPSWTFLRVTDDYLVGLARAEPKQKQMQKLKARKFGFYGLESSARVVVLNRRSGKVLWRSYAKHGFRHNGVVCGRGKLFVIDRPSRSKPGRGANLGGRVAAFDLKTGKPLWSHQSGVFGTWLSYSEEHDVLVEAGLVTRDTLFDEANGMRAFRGATGAVLWHQPKYSGPALIHGRLVLKGESRGNGGSACDLLTGEPHLVPDPITGGLAPWRWLRQYGCNTPAASQHLMLFRSGAAGYFDLACDGGTGNLGGFRSSCTLNLIPAGGVLAAPDYTRTCTCSYQNQTSLAFVHMPDAEMWTFTTTRRLRDVVRRAGVNFGAPGGRRADDGTLWLECPRVGGPSPALGAYTEPKAPRTFRLHSSQVKGAGPAWVTASGAHDLRALYLELGGEKAQRRRYRVRLFFLEPDTGRARPRLFDVTVQGQKLYPPVELSAPRTGVVREAVAEAGNLLKVEFGPGAVVSGVEVVADGW